MELAICSLASGSSGNSYVIRSEKTALLVDAGISNKQICSGLEKLGLRAEDLSGVFVTHEHSDHIKGLPVLLKRCGAKLYTTQLTADQLPVDPDRVRAVEPGEVLDAGDIEVSCFSLSHDAADPVGYSFRSGGSVITVVTDTGTVTDDIRTFIGRSDILVLESNHDVNMLRVGRYPWFLKQRILSDRGHLSNEAAAVALAEVLKAESEAGALKRRIVLLAHLSRENNFPEMALATMENILQEYGFAAGKETRIDVLKRDVMSALYTCGQ